jgi:hypothetical protein
MKPSLRLILLAAISAVILMGCCTKKFCIGATYAIIDLTFQGFTGQQLDSVAISEYDKTSGQLMHTYSLSGATDFEIGPQYVYKDSCYIKQRYFIIAWAQRTDTINNISYQQGTKTINCNNCPGEKDVVYYISNFTFNYRGATYNNINTLTIVN